MSTRGSMVRSSFSAARAGVDLPRRREEAQTVSHLDRVTVLDEEIVFTRPHLVQVTVGRPSPAQTASAAPRRSAWAW